MVLFIQTIFSFKTKIFNGGNSKDEFIVCTPRHTHTHTCIHTHRTFIHLLTTETLIRKNPGTLEFKNFRFSVIFNGGFEHFAFLCLYPEMDKPVKTDLKKHPKAKVLVKITYITELNIQGACAVFFLPATVAPWQQDRALRENLHKSTIIVVA